jgi:hypothetical protein
MTDPAGERTPRRRPSAEPARGGTPRQRSGATGKSTRAAADAGRPSRSARAGGKAGGAPAKARSTSTRQAKPASEPAAPERPERGAGGQWPMAQRSLLPSVLGVPPVAAVGIAVALTAIGVFVDLTRIGNLGTVFTICHITGCVLAVVWVRRNGLFGPMVQPPLLVAATVPVVVLMSASPRPGQGVAEQLLVIGAPLVNAFPVMAWATGTVLVLGLARIVLQRPGRV